VKLKLRNEIETKLYNSKCCASLSQCKTMRKQKQTIKVQNIYRNIKNTNTTIKMKIVKIQKNKNVKTGIGASVVDAPKTYGCPKN
jgi:hypothetical protein